MHSALWFEVYPYDNDGTEHHGRCLENITSLHLWKENEDKNLKFKKLKKLKCQKRLKKIENTIFRYMPFPLEMFWVSHSHRGQSHGWFCPLSGQRPCGWLNGNSSNSTLSYFPSSLLYYLWFDRIIGTFIFFLLLAACQAMGRERAGSQSLDKPDFGGERPHQPFHL